VSGPRLDLSAREWGRLAAMLVIILVVGPFQDALFGFVLFANAAAIGAGFTPPGQRARAIAVERYDWERVVDGLEAVCAEVVPGWQ